VRGVIQLAVRAAKHKRFPRCRPREPEQQSQTGRLTRAVGAKKGGDRPGLERERDSVHGDHVAVALRQAANPHDVIASAQAVGAHRRCATAASNLSSIDTDPPRPNLHNQAMHYIRIYNSDDGTARFGDEEIAFTDAAFAPPAPPCGVSPPLPAREVLFIRLPAGWTDPAHPAPARQWMLVMSGRGESTAGDETRQWGPGDTLLVEDTGPPGHATTVFEEAVVAVVRC